MDVRDCIQESRSFTENKVGSVIRRYYNAKNDVLRYLGVPFKSKAETIHVDKDRESQHPEDRSGNSSFKNVQLESSATTNVSGSFVKSEVPFFAKHGTLYVDYGVAGNRVKFEEAFDPSLPWSQVEDFDFEARENMEARNQQKIYQKKDIRLYLAITTTPCSRKSQERRTGIRQTWIRSIKEQIIPIDYGFFVSQPDECDPIFKKQFEEELMEHQDIVFLRGHDIYTNLFNKTHGMFKYALSHPKSYTHILKTDDDVYIRTSKLLELIWDSEHGPYMKWVYKGNIENNNGYQPFRDPASKWYQSYEELTDEMIQNMIGTHYAAGWGYLVSRDVAFHAMKKIYRWEQDSSQAPAWRYKFNNLEDIMFGFLVSDFASVDYDGRFKTPFQICDPSTTVVHLDVDSPVLLKPLYELDISGTWDKETVICSTGDFPPGDYYAWFDWRNSLFQDGEKSI